MAEKNRWIKILFAVVTLLVCFIIVILLIDITNPAVGWFRYQQAHGSGSLFEHLQFLVRALFPN